MSTTTATVLRTDAKPSARQIYAIAHALIDVAGLEWPADRGAASTLLEQLREQRDAITADAAAPADIPF